jgi:hypothetical protein
VWTSGEEEESLHGYQDVTLEFLGGGILVLHLDRNQRQECKQRSKEFYLQGSERKGHMERCASGPRI